jgi:AraC-like DNA-binding protein
MPVNPLVYCRIVEAKLFIDNNYQLPIHLEQVAKSAYLSRYHFHRLFTRIYKTTPHRYLTTKRISFAKELLSGDINTITEICTLVGFESITSFHVLFKKETGCSPGIYRNRAHRRMQETRLQPARFIPACFLQNGNFTAQ